MSAHTKGPWRNDGDAVRCNVEWSKRGGVVATVYDPNDSQHHTSTSEANARLIAAAPDLLAACEAGQRLAMLALQSQRYETDVEYRCATDAVLGYRAAVAKAREG